MAHQALSAPSSANSRAKREIGGKNRASSGNSEVTSLAPPARMSRANATPQNAVEFCVARFLRSFQALSVAARLYQKNHPLALSALEAAELYLRAALERVSPILIGLEDDVLVFVRRTRPSRHRWKSTPRGPGWRITGNAAAYAHFHFFRKQIWESWTPSAAC